MLKTIQEILLHERENLEDAILSCLTDLNMLQNFTAEELGMTVEEIVIDSKKEAAKIEGYACAKEKIDHWLTFLQESKDGEKRYKELIFEDLPWLKEKLKGAEFIITKRKKD